MVSTSHAKNDLIGKLREELIRTAKGGQKPSADKVTTEFFLEEGESEAQETHPGLHGQRLGPFLGSEQQNSGSEPTWTGTIPRAAEMSRSQTGSGFILPRPRSYMQLLSGHEHPG